MPGQATVTSHLCIPYKTLSRPAAKDAAGTITLGIPSDFALYLIPIVPIPCNTCLLPE
jgi:hypothetical protein